MTHLVSETLLLEVQAGGAGERGTLRGGREDVSPGRQSALHSCENKKNGNGIKELGRQKTTRGWKKGWGKRDDT